MKQTELSLCFIALLYAASAVHADESPMQTESSSSALIYYGPDQPFARPAPPTFSSVPPRTYIPSAPQDFIPIASEHVFYDSQLPTVADANVRVFIRSYDPERGIYVNDEVLDPSCLLACLTRQEQAMP
ncbi:hypothetical protein [Pseudomonas frederiksbergensis]|uniref:hypothetical protein n=1 Tax=Pseudomonas frederiksbergensis TaxID=104087 RepID=UPI000F46FF88|nr:hypothetical protein [Pseudomonas frederiksbergensis]RON56294.1 hypothetical protein BK667_08090 [Pseudomonas frederiksbergensis]